MTGGVAHTSPETNILTTVTVPTTVTKKAPKVGKATKIQQREKRCDSTGCGETTVATRQSASVHHVCQERRSKNNNNNNNNRYIETYLYEYGWVQCSSMFGTSPLENNPDCAWRIGSCWKDCLVASWPETRSTFKRKCVAVWVKGNIAVLIGTLPLLVFLSRGCAPGFRLAARARRLRQPP